MSNNGLQMTYLRFVGKSDCERVCSTKLPSKSFCLYGDHGNDACRGDSGSGVLWRGYALPFKGYFIIIYRLSRLLIPAGMSEPGSPFHPTSSTLLGLRQTLQQDHYWYRLQVSVFFAATTCPYQRRLSFRLSTMSWTWRLPEMYVLLKRYFGVTPNSNPCIVLARATPSLLQLWRPVPVMWNAVTGHHDILCHTFECGDKTC